MFIIGQLWLVDDDKIAFVIRLISAGNDLKAIEGIIREARKLSRIQASNLDAVENFKVGR